MKTKNDVISLYNKLRTDLENKYGPTMSQAETASTLKLNWNTVRQMLTCEPEDAPVWSRVLLEGSMRRTGGKGERQRFIFRTQAVAQALVAEELHVANDEFAMQPSRLMQQKGKPAMAVI